MNRIQNTPCRGFTLVDMAIALAIVAVLVSMAVPSWQAQIRQARRADAYAAIGQVHLAQEAWRANHPTYASRLDSAGLGLPAASPQGHYTLAVSAAASSTATSYVVTAMARGRQGADRGCATLGLVVDGGDLRFVSATSTGQDNDAAGNRRCWGR